MLWQPENLYSVKWYQNKVSLYS